MLAALLSKSQDELVRLLAVFVAATVDVVTPRATHRQSGEVLAQALSLDMAAWWKPTAEGYFLQMTWAQTLAAVEQFAPSHVGRLSKLKKGDLAMEAERLAGEAGWMPAAFGSAQVMEQVAACEALGAGVVSPDAVDVAGHLEGQG